MEGVYILHLIQNIKKPVDHWQTGFQEKTFRHSYGLKIIFFINSEKNLKNNTIA